MNAIITAITDVFDAVSDWLVTALSNLTSVFYVPETGLTLIGTCSMIGLGMSVVFLLISVVGSFLHFGRR